MVVKHVRIDDRLVHGQIVTAWINESKANTILVADDIAAKDATQKMLLALAVPKRIKFILKNIEEASDYLKSECEDEVLLLLRNPETANRLFNLGFHIDSLNVGNISNSKSDTPRTKLLAYIHVSSNDVQNLREIAKKGVKLDVRSVPTDRSIDGLELIKNL